MPAAMQAEGQVPVVAQKNEQGAQKDAPAQYDGTGNDGRHCAKYLPGCAIAVWEKMTPTYHWWGMLVPMSW